MQEGLINAIVLLNGLEHAGRDRSEGAIKAIMESLSGLSPACESNMQKYHEICMIVKSKVGMPG